MASARNRPSPRGQTVAGRVRSVGPIEFLDFNGFLQKGHGEEPAKCGRLKTAEGTLSRHAPEGDEFGRTFDAASAPGGSINTFTAMRS